MKQLIKNLIFHFIVFVDKKRRSRRFVVYVYSVIVDMR
jgi:hypothetical protein